jgi:hypothetical protein
MLWARCKSYTEPVIVNWSGRRSTCRLSLVTPNGTRSDPVEHDQTDPNLSSGTGEKMWRDEVEIIRQTREPILTYRSDSRVWTNAGGSGVLSASGVEWNSRILRPTISCAVTFWPPFAVFHARTHLRSMLSNQVGDIPPVTGFSMPHCVPVIPVPGEDTETSPSASESL